MTRPAWESVHLAGLSLPLLRSEPSVCPYLPDRFATPLFLISSLPDAAIYQQLMDAGFRRSGQVVYANRCLGCRACVSIRVPVAEFRASKSQRRVLRRNADIEVRVDVPHCDEERRALYERYQMHVHGSGPVSMREYEQFLFIGGDYTLEMFYWIEGQLAGVGIVDACPSCLSSVYFFYDPAHAKRSLGVFSALREIEECRERGLPYWYSGYFVHGNDKMRYKADFRPHEFLHDDGVWRPA